MAAAWDRLASTGGRVAIGQLAAEVGWSHKHLIARFRQQVGLSPKIAARLIRLDRARRAAARPGADPPGRRHPRLRIHRRRCRGRHHRARVHRDRSLREPAGRRAGRFPGGRLLAHGRVLHRDGELASWKRPSPTSPAPHSQPQRPQPGLPQHPSASRPRPLHQRNKLRPLPRGRTTHFDRTSPPEQSAATACPQTPRIQPPLRGLVGSKRFVW